MSLTAGDHLVGMVVANPEATLLTACENGYGKRTWFGTGDETSDDDTSSSMRYRRQKRGGKGIRDIKTTRRNGQVVGILPVTDEDEILMMTSRGKLQRISCADINPIGRNTQGVRIMTLDEDDTLAAIVRVPPDENGDDNGDETLENNGDPNDSMAVLPPDATSESDGVEPEAVPPDDREDDSDPENEA